MVKALEVKDLQLAIQNVFFYFFGSYNILFMKVACSLQSEIMLIELPLLELMVDATSFINLVSRQANARGMMSQYEKRKTFRK